MIVTTRPDDFQPTFSVASCFLERTDGKILLLLRLPHKSEGGKWGVPAGKVEEGESPEQAITREIAEETSLVAVAPSFLEHTMFDFRTTTSFTIYFINEFQAMCGYGLQPESTGSLDGLRLRKH